MPRRPLSDEEKRIRKTIANNLKKITHGYTRVAVSDLTGIPVSTLSGYFTEKSTISKENAEVIAEKFNVDKADIDPRYSRNYDLVDLKKEVLEELRGVKGKITGDDFVRLSNATEKLDLGLSMMTTDRGNKITALYHDVHDYNFFDANVAAGVPTTIEAFDDDHFEQIGIPDMVMGKYAGCSDVFFTSINGDSMNNVIPNKSMIAVKKIDSTLDFENGDIVVFSKDNEFSVKRFINDKDNDRLIFRPDSKNPSFTDVVVSYEDTDNLVLYGKVVVYVVNL